MAFTGRIRRRKAIAPSIISSASSLGDSEGKRACSWLIASSIASPEIWLGSLPGFDRPSWSFHASWRDFSSMA
jgi:hypothetical protein